MRPPSNIATPHPRPPGAIEAGVLGPTLEWSLWSFPHHDPGEFGRWALAHCLHSRGSDFTSGRSNHENPGASALRRLWAGTPSEAHQHVLAWVLFHDGNPVAVCAWEQTLSPSGDWQAGSLLDRGKFRCLGRVSLWNKPEYRGRGWMGSLMKEAVCPAIEAEATRCADGEEPFIRAADATVPILSRASALRVVPYFSASPEHDAKALKASENEALRRPRILR